MLYLIDGYNLLFALGVLPHRAGPKGLENARLRHAHRLTSEPNRNWTRDDLMRLEPIDIFAGRGDPELEPGTF